jgi:hypothetical protein
MGRRRGSRVGRPVCGADDATDAGAQARAPAGRVGAGRPVPAAAAADRALARVLEDGAVALGELHATQCPSRMPGPVSAARRLAAVELLGEEDALSAVGRLAVVDATARWLDEDAGGELAHALLAAVCSAEATANRAYLALLGA